jgi:translation initiation factor IF-3
VDEEGEQMGILAVEDAVQAAEDRDLDLVEVAPNSDPPVCKIMDYGRYKYTQQKKGKEAKKRQKIVMRIKIDEHDYTFKKNHAERFLMDGNKAKVTIMFRGREVTHPDLGRKLLERVANELVDISVVEQSPLLEGRNMTMVLAPNKAAQKAAKEKESSAGTAKSGKKASQPGQEGPLKAPLAEALENVGDSPDESSDGTGGSEEEAQPEEGTSDAKA